MKENENSFGFVIFTRIRKRCAQLLRTLVLGALRKTDLNKWEKFQFPKEWTIRSQRIAELVPRESWVFEFGAGDSNLSALLDPSCTLVSSDLIARRPGMVVLDLNRRPLPQLNGVAPRIAVFAGVLEYVSDVPTVLRWVANQFDMCIASYECAALRSDLFGRLREKFGRAHHGWVNHFTESELKALFDEVGFCLVEQTKFGGNDPGQIFVFHAGEKNMARSEGVR